jgi:hypothetical protein
MKKSLNDQKLADAQAQASAAPHEPLRMPRNGEPARQPAAVPDAQPTPSTHSTVVVAEIPRLLQLSDEIALAADVPGLPAGLTSPAVAPEPALAVSAVPRRSRGHQRQRGDRAHDSRRSQQLRQDSMTRDAEFVAILAAQMGQAPSPTPAQRPPVTLTFVPRIAPSLKVPIDPDDFSRLTCKAHGPEWMGAANPSQGEREVVVGLDFGTSTVKAVIADRSTGHAYAVPFSLALGLNRYLLPSRVHESTAGFHLDVATGSVTYRDLKLGLLARPDTPQMIRATAFLALALRHVRDWFLSEHAAAYRQSKLVWNLRLGQPATVNMVGHQADVFRQLGMAAWCASFEAGASVRLVTVQRALDRARELNDGSVAKVPIEEIELKVVPEIAAQIYGFVKSRRFDPNARNLYLMVDVGAGTVDAAIFHVKKKGGKWDFEFYTCTVQPYGAMNLHRTRLDWWAKALAGSDAGAKLEDAIAAARFPTDRVAVLPISVADYVAGVQVSYSNVAHDPDEDFFIKKVVSQVRGESYWRAWKEGFLSQDDLRGLPAFLCGGGSRMPFYGRLKKELKRMPSYTWLHAEFEPFAPPGELEAPGLMPADYDRLSVAFGLSFLEVGEVCQALPLPKLPQQSPPRWQDGYPGKDQM